MKETLGGMPWTELPTTREIDAGPAAARASDRQPARPQHLHAPTHSEAAMRATFGIPDEARAVLVFGETTHWDPNWLLTSEGYYRWRIHHTFDEAIKALLAEPRRVFALENVFFLRMYWEREPARRDVLRQLFAEGRLELTGTGITTPDTNLPSTEAIVRDYLLGKLWLAEQQIPTTPTVVYLPDDFGVAPTTPTLLRALGYHRAAITRIDGMFFVGSDYRRRREFPLPGSSAALLQQEHQTLDFVWRGLDGSDVLCHWNAFTYFHGDMLAHFGVIRWMGIVFGIPWRTQRHIARRIARFVEELGPLARTPYLFCAVGCDFNGPIRDLTGLLDRYNERYFKETGIYAVCAGLEDYLTLVDFHRARLPIAQLDPNPYWMGFYATRPAIKAQTNRTVRRLLAAEEQFSGEVLNAGAPAGEERAALEATLDRAWNRIAVSNHHDFITGTSPDRVWLKEQQPWLEEAAQLADEALRYGTRPRAMPAQALPPPHWERDGYLVRVATDHYEAVFNEVRGGCLVGLRARADGRELLAGPANDGQAFADAGGLWRLGHEYRGGHFRLREACASALVPLRVETQGAEVVVVAESVLDRRPLRREVRLRSDTPVLSMRVHGAARRRTTVAIACPTSLQSDGLAMDVPAGVVERPPRKLYEPTFWPARSFAHLSGGEGSGLAVVFGGPAAVSLEPDGVLRWMVLRNATKERAYKVLPVLAHPASGTDDEPHTIVYALVVTGPGDWRACGLHREAARLVRRWALDGAAEPLSVVVVEEADVLVQAVKPAADGRGVVVRLQRFDPDCVVAHLRTRAGTIAEAFATDATEEDLHPLTLRDGVVVVPLPYDLVTVRLIPPVR